MRFAIRTDASIDIGTGHVMRCLTLADVLIKRNIEVIFICRALPGNSIEFIKSKKYSVLVLPEPGSSEVVSSNDLKINDWLKVSLSQDAEETHGLLDDKKKWDWLVIDHYGIDERWEKTQRDVVDKIMVIDDLANRMHDCDVLLDQNYYLNMDARYTNKVSENCLQLLGPKYTLLRREFSQQRNKSVRYFDVVSRVLVFFGGVDLPNMTGRSLVALGHLDSDDIKIDVVIGATNPHRSEIEKICDQLDNATLYVQASNIAELMANADLSIGGGGTATWERCCVGLPAIAWPIADNQRKLLQDAAVLGAVYVPDSENPSTDEIILHTTALLKNSRLRTHMSEKALDFIDGKGTDRVVNSLVTRDIRLREINKNDIKKIFDWRNDASVRNRSHNVDEITFAQHEQWCNKVIHDPNRLLLIGLLDDEEIGVLRFDMADEQAEISIYLAPKSQGKGYGSDLINAGEMYLIENKYKVVNVVAEILEGNSASEKLFEYCGYVRYSRRYMKRLEQ